MGINREVEDCCAVLSILYIVRFSIKADGAYIQDGYIKILLILNKQCDYNEP